MNSPKIPSIVAIVSVVLLSVFVLAFIQPKNTSPVVSPSSFPSSEALGSSIRTISSNRANVSFGEKIINLELAHTPSEKQLGLGGRTGLSEDTGMLFFLEAPAREGFWMKGMLFSIDILWLDENLKVISLAESVSPDTYPEVFYPSAPASFVLELPAGYSRAHSIKVGSQFVFPVQKTK